MSSAPASQRAVGARAALRALVLCLALLPAHGFAGAEHRPFSAGETLSYDVEVGGMGGGVGELRVEDGAPVRGEGTVLLRFDFDAKVGPFRVHHHSRSQLSTLRFASLHYEINETTPLGSVKERVELFPDERRWVSAHGEGVSATSEPLDELSFIYFLRTLELAPGGIYRLPRHFDASRGDVKVRVLRREPLHVSAGDFKTVLVEMEVRDPARYGGKGTLRIHFTDDAERLPVRIESQVPVAGQLTLQLRSLPKAEPRVEVVP